MVNYGFILQKAEKLFVYVRENMISGLSYILDRKLSRLSVSISIKYVKYLTWVPAINSVKNRYSYIKHSGWLFWNKCNLTYAVWQPERERCFYI